MAKRATIFCLTWVVALFAIAGTAKAETLIDTYTGYGSCATGDDHWISNGVPINGGWFQTSGSFSGNLTMKTVLKQQTAGTSVPVYAYILPENQNPVEAAIVATSTDYVDTDNITTSWQEFTWHFSGVSLSASTNYIIAFAFQRLNGSVVYGGNGVYSCHLGPAAVGEPYYYELNSWGGGSGIYTTASNETFVVSLTSTPSTGSITTRWLEPYDPINGALATTTSQSFTAGYYFNDTTHFGLLDTVAFEIHDLTDGTTVTTGDTLISASGYATNTTAYTITQDHVYLWRPIMYSSATTSTAIYGTWYNLQGSTTVAWTPYTPAGSNDVSTSTTPNVKDFLTFLNVPNLLKTKIPFAYFFEAKDAIEQGIATTTTTEIPSGGIEYKIGSLATTTADIFSTTTMAKYLTDEQIAILRGIMVIILYAEFGYAMYHRFKSTKHI